MLQNLHVKNLALIDEAEVDFEKGLNILTGETGAGKSILLGSVNLALGGKYSADLLRKGASYGLVELVFSVTGESQKRALEALSVVPEEDTVILSRKLMAGRSTCRVNGETVPAGKLKEIAGILIDIHGQHEHQSLLYKKNHLQILDEFAKEELKTIKADYLECYRFYKQKQKELEDACMDEVSRKKEADFLAYEINEIEEAALKDGEDDLLEESYQRMLASRKVMERLQEAYMYTMEQDASAGELVARSARLVQELTGYDKKAEAIYDQLSQIDSLLSDVAREMAEYMSSWEFSEEEYFETEERLNVINHIKNRYGDSIAEIKKELAVKQARLDILNDYDFYMERLRKETEDAKKKLAEQAEVLSGLRKEASEALAGDIRKNLLDLNFLDVKFEIVFNETQDFTPGGTDDVEFMISMNPGLPIRPLAEIASGGELSRIMLAIKTVLADKDAIETLIFDEIDVGISGRTAQKVSEKMAYIGKKHQVICITHLAQIAAMADAHYLIEKTVGEEITTTTMKLLDEKESVEELARILGGAEITETVLKNAKEMKELAKRTK